jgi:hypothetical protein
MYSVAPLAVLVVIAMKDVGPCNTVSSQVMISAKKAKEFIKRGDKTVRSYYGSTGLSLARQVPAPAAEIASGAAQPVVQFAFVGTIALKPSALASKRFGDFLRARIAGADIGSFLSTRSEDARGTMTVRATFSHPGAGSACVRLSGTATDHMQKYQGTFAVLGGAGRAAQLHASGTFRAIQPAPYSNQYQIAFYTTPSFGRSRAMPNGCGQPTAPSTGAVKAHSAASPWRRARPRRARTSTRTGRRSAVRSPVAAEPACTECCNTRDPYRC